MGCVFYSANIPLRSAWVARYRRAIHRFSRLRERVYAVSPISTAVMAWSRWAQSTDLQCFVLECYTSETLAFQDMILCPGMLTMPLTYVNRLHGFPISSDEYLGWSRQPITDTRPVPYRPGRFRE